MYPVVIGETQAETKDSIPAKSKNRKCTNILSLTNSVCGKLAYEHHQLKVDIMEKQDSANNTLQT